MKRIIELSALAIVITAVSGLIVHLNVEQGLNALIRGVFQKIIPWMNITFNV